MVCGRRCDASPPASSSARQPEADVLSSINWDTYWLYLLTEAALSLSPGPAVMLVIAYGLTHCARHSLYAALGVLTANPLYFALSATALRAAVAASEAL